MVDEYEHPENGWWPSLWSWLKIFRMVGDHSWDGGILSWEWLVSILGMKGEHPGDGGWPPLWWWVTNRGMVDYSPGTSIWQSWGCWGKVGDHPWLLSPGLNFVSLVCVPNSKSVVYFIVHCGRFWLGFLSQQGKTKSTPSMTNLNCTGRHGLEFDKNKIIIVRQNRFSKKL